LQESAAPLVLLRLLPLCEVVRTAMLPQIAHRYHPVCCWIGCQD
jgi:hypothetical protein